jgi:formylglycine-generating enzyme required for sulfatase activity
MIGNVEEWCEGAGGEAIARGGAFDTLPRRAKFRRRIQYYPWQRVYNTGIRLVMEGAR